MRNSRLLATAILVGGVGLTILAGWMINVYQAAARNEQIALQTDSATYAVRVGLDRLAVGVQAVRALYYAAGSVSQKEFERFAKTLSAREAFRSLSFLRRVSADERAGYEKRFTSDPAKMLGIWQYGANGEPTAAPVRHVYFVIESDYLLSGGDLRFGFDVSSDPNRANAIAEAERDGLPLTSVAEVAGAGAPRIWLYIPVRDRSGKEIGLASVSATLDDLSNIARLASGVTAVDIHLADVDAMPQATAVESTEQALDERRFNFANQTWTVRVTPGPLVGDFAGSTTILVIIAGLAATALALAYLSNLGKTAELGEARARLADMLNGLGPLAWLLEPDGTVISANRSAVAAFGEVEHGAKTLFWELPFDGIDATKSEQVRQAVGSAARREDVRFDLDLENADHRRVLDIWIRSLQTVRGAVENLVVSAVDVTERYESEETQRLLMGELDHRMKNTLQVIQAIIRRTAASHDNVEKFERSLIGRVNAMARAHELLADERWIGADIGTIVSRESTNFDAADAIRSSGPHIRLNPKAALSIALATHELGTNAAKYGALSVPGGKVDVSWSIERNNNEPRFVLRWTEVGGPPVEQPTRQGFGSMLIERSIAYELDGQTTVEYRREGFACMISAPLSAVRPFASDVHLARESRSNE